MKQLARQYFKCKVPPAAIMYNSHGVYTSLKKIYELEEEDRGNDTFDNVPQKFIKEHAASLAIWACIDSISAFRYAVDAIENNLTDEELKAKYPNWQDMIVAIDTTDFSLIAEDSDGGYLLVKLS